MLLNVIINSEVSVYRDGDVKYKPDLKEGKQMTSRKKLTVKLSVTVEQMWNSGLFN